MAQRPEQILHNTLSVFQVDAQYCKYSVGDFIISFEYCWKFSKKSLENNSKKRLFLVTEIFFVVV